MMSNFVLTYIYIPVRQFSAYYLILNIAINRYMYTFFIPTFKSIDVLLL